ncbi:MAG: hypothetical protein DBX97_04985 [Collinsella tanakaei]|nr:MAG: hypothetical protein DBX97_04985 [Collinsella tanakaei]
MLRGALAPILTSSCWGFYVRVLSRANVSGRGRLRARGRGRGRLRARVAGAGLRARGRERGLAASAK